MCESKVFRFQLFSPQVKSFTFYMRAVLSSPPGLVPTCRPDQTREYGLKPCHANALSGCDPGRRRSPFVLSLSPGGVYKRVPTLKCVNCDFDVCDHGLCAGIRCRSEVEVGYIFPAIFIIVYGCRRHGMLVGNITV